MLITDNQVALGKMTLNFLSAASICLTIYLLAKFTAVTILETSNCRIELELLKGPKK